MRPDIVGQTFGRLTVVRLVDHATRRSWLCRCSCGLEVVASDSSLRTGHKKSCGCLKTENVRSMHLKHGCARGGKRSAEYRIWIGMIVRCENPRATNYPRYGGRGVAVCARWRDDFGAFLADVGPRPSGLHSLDRIDPTGNYEPANVRWADAATQSRNRGGVMSEATAREIREALRAGASLAATAQRFGISKSHAHRIRSGAAWAAVA